MKLAGPVRSIAPRPSARRPRTDQGLSLHALAAGRLSLPPPADLLGIRRRGARPLRPVGRRVDDARAPRALPALGHLGHRPCARGSAARRALVRALALRALVVASTRRLSELLQPPRRLGRAEFRRLGVPGARLRGVGRDAAHAELGQARGVVGRAQRQRRAGIAGLRGAREQQPRAPRYRPARSTPRCAGTRSRSRRGRARAGAVRRLAPQLRTSGGMAATCTGVVCTARTGSRLGRRSEAVRQRHGLLGSAGGGRRALARFRERRKARPPRRQRRLGFRLHGALQRHGADHEERRERRKADRADDARQHADRRAARAAAAASPPDRATAARAAARPRGRRRTACRASAPPPPAAAPAAACGGIPRSPRARCPPLRRPPRAPPRAPKAARTSSASAAIDRRLVSNRSTHHSSSRRPHGAVCYACPLEDWSSPCLPLRDFGQAARFARLRPTAGIPGTAGRAPRSAAPTGFDGAPRHELVELLALGLRLARACAAIPRRPRSASSPAAPRRGWPRAISDGAAASGIRRAWERSCRRISGCGDSDRCPSAS